ncbi:hypothetical protein E4U58_000040 [Claviceps cyperi]|nr:hypothetical protein E4U58_000040 [Claviceps cyperi]
MTHRVITKVDGEVGKTVFWHSSAHVLGEACERRYGCYLCNIPQTKDPGLLLRNGEHRRCDYQPTGPAFSILRTVTVTSRDPNGFTGPCLHTAEISGIADQGISVT